DSDGHIHRWNSRHAAPTVGAGSSEGGGQTLVPVMMWRKMTMTEALKVQSSKSKWAPANPKPPSLDARLLATELVQPPVPELYAEMQEAPAGEVETVLPGGPGGLVNF